MFEHVFNGPIAHVVTVRMVVTVVTSIADDRSASLLKRVVTGSDEVEPERSRR